MDFKSELEEIASKLPHPADYDCPVCVVPIYDNNPPYSLWDSEEFVSIKTQQFRRIRMAEAGVMYSAWALEGSNVPVWPPLKSRESLWLPSIRGPVFRL